MPDSKEPVVFKLPDGTEVSNDPRKAEDDLRKQFLANLQSGQDFVAKERAKTDQAKKEPVVDESDKVSSRSQDPEDPDGGSGDGGDGGDDDFTPIEEADNLDDMKTEELKGEVARLRDEGVEVQTKGVKNKNDLVNNIRAAIREHNGRNS